MNEIFSKTGNEAFRNTPYIERILFNGRQFARGFCVLY